MVVLGGCVYKQQGPPEVHFKEVSAKPPKDDTVTVVRDGAKLIALAYNYDLSKRTAVGLTYAKLTNDVGAMYQLFQNTILGNAASGQAPGEDARLIALTLRHAF